MKVLKIFLTICLLTPALFWSPRAAAGTNDFNILCEMTDYIQLNGLPDVKTKEFPHTLYPEYLDILKPRYFDMTLMVHTFYECYLRAVDMAKDNWDFAVNPDDAYSLETSPRYVKWSAQNIRTETTAEGLANGNSPVHENENINGKKMQTSKIFSGDQRRWSDGSPIVGQ